MSSMPPPQPVISPATSMMPMTRDFTCMCRLEQDLDVDSAKAMPFLGTTVIILGQFWGNSMGTWKVNTAGKLELTTSSSCNPNGENAFAPSTSIFTFAVRGDELFTRYDDDEQACARHARRAGKARARAGSPPGPRGIGRTHPGGPPRARAGLVSERHPSGRAVRPLPGAAWTGTWAGPSAFPQEGRDAHVQVAVQDAQQAVEPRGVQRRPHGGRWRKPPTWRKGPTPPA
ncbi:hypothetical protein COSO111634_19820 [Corallococcus soli]